MTTGRWIDALDGASVVTPVSDTESSRAFSGRSCGRREHCAERNEIDRLYRSLDEVTPESHPRTAKLLASSKRKVAQKVFEEAGEVALEAVRHNARGIVQESADLLYNLVALWYRAGIRPDDVWAEMRCRAEGLGIAEKPSKQRGHITADPSSNHLLRHDPPQGSLAPDSPGAIRSRARASLT